MLRLSEDPFGARKMTIDGKADPAVPVVSGVGAVSSRGSGEPPAPPARDLFLGRWRSAIREWLCGSRAGWSILGIGVALRVIWILAVDIDQPYDAKIYYDGAVSIFLGHGLPLAGVPSGHWPVGYQGFLAALFLAFGESSAVAQWANVGLSALLLVATAGFVRSATGSVGLGRVAMGLVAISPTMVTICSLSMPEVLYLALMMTGAWAWLAVAFARPAAIVTGFVFGLAVLVRPQFVLLPVVFAVMRPFSLQQGFAVSRRLVQAGFVLIAMAIVLSPWLIRNLRAYDHFVFVSTNSGIMMLSGNGPNATGAYMDPSDAVDQLPPDFDNGVRGDRMARRMAIEHMLDHPVETLARLPKKLWYTFRSGLGVVNWVQAGIEQRSGEEARWYLGIKVVCQGYYMAVVAFGVWVAGAWLGGRGWRLSPEAGPAIVYAVMAILLLIVPVLVAFGSARYNLAMMPWFSVLAAVGVGAWLRISDHRPVAPRLPGITLGP